MAPPLVVATDARRSFFNQPRAAPARGRPFSVPSLSPAAGSRPRWLEGRRCVTPRQMCPRPDGFGRNLRSKTRWFTGFCNSHQVSHFATFFIDARAEISVAESRSRLSKWQASSRAPFPARGRRRLHFGDFPWRVPRRVLLFVPPKATRTDTGAIPQHDPRTPPGGAGGSARKRLSPPTDGHTRVRGLFRYGFRQ